MTPIPAVETRRIPVTMEHAGALEAWLLEINGARAKAKTYTTVRQLLGVAREAQYALSTNERIDGVIGVRFEAQSGNALPDSYKFGVRTTRIILEYEADFWVLVEVAPDTLKPMTHPVRKITIYVGEEDELMAA